MLTSHQKLSQWGVAASWWATVSWVVVLEKKPYPQFGVIMFAIEYSLYVYATPKIWSPSDKSFLVNQWVTLDNSTAAL
jgi:hypothetical protein